MAKKILINPTLVGSRFFQPGTEFDTVGDAADIATIASVGGVLVPKELVATMAPLALQVKSRAAQFSDSAAASLMLIAALAGGLGAIQVAQVVLVAGVGPTSLGANLTVTAATKAFQSLRTPGGTLGAAYKIGYTVGAAGVGQITVTAVDTAGATVATDTSTIDLIIVG